MTFSSFEYDKFVDSKGGFDLILLNCKYDEISKSILLDCRNKNDVKCILFSNSSSITRDVLILLINYLPNLEYVEFNECIDINVFDGTTKLENITKRNLKTLVNGLKKLRYLRIENCDIAQETIDELEQILQTR